MILRPVAAALLVACDAGAACADYLDAVDACVGAVEDATGVPLPEARPSPDVTCADPEVDGEAVWACRAAAYAASPCDGAEALTALAADLADCADL